MSYACILVSSKMVTDKCMPNSIADVDVNSDNRVSRFNRKRTHLTLSQCDLNNSPCTHNLHWRCEKPELQPLWKFYVSFSFTTLRMDKSSNNRPLRFPFTPIFQLYHFKCTWNFFVLLSAINIESFTNVRSFFGCMGVKWRSSIKSSNIKLTKNMSRSLAQKVSHVVNNQSIESS